MGTTNSGLLGELAVSLGNGDGTFASPKILDFGGGSTLGYGIAVADFNGDGKPDVFVGGFTPPFDTGIFLGNGDGTFQSFGSGDGAVEPAQAIDLLAWGPALASDFNGDGKEDVLGGDTVLLNLGVSSGTGTPTAPAATTTTLSASSSSVAQGAALTLTATVSDGSSSGTPTGTITFNDGSTPLGTATLSSGAGSFSISSLGAGAHSITASYGGDASFTASTSSAITVTITAPPPPPAGYGLSLNPASGSVAATGSTTTSLTITPVNGFHQVVSFACSGLPAGSACSFAPSTITPAGAAVVTTMTVTTGATASLAHPAVPGKLPFTLGGGLLSLALLGSRRRMRSRLLSWLAVCALGVTILGVGSCSSGSGGSSMSGSGGGGGSAAPSGTAPGTSAVTVTATGGTVTQTATYTLTVQ